MQAMGWRQQVVEEHACKQALPTKGLINIYSAREETGIRF
jgi:hypothetical protein